VVLLSDRKTVRGYLNPAYLGTSETLDLLTPDGERHAVSLEDVRSVYFVREFTDDFEPERKAFLSRPKLDGLWVRLRFRDNDTIEGVVPNDLLAKVSLLGKDYRDYSLETVEMFYKDAWAAGYHIPLALRPAAS